MWAMRRLKGDSKHLGSKLWSFKIAIQSDMPTLSLAICRASGRRHHSDYSFTKNVEDSQYGWTATSELLTVFGDSNESVEPRRLDEVILRVAAWLNCSYDKAVNILLSKPHLRSCHLETMDAYVSFLNKNGVSSELLCSNLWLLDETITAMRYKFNLVSQVLHGAPLNSNTIKLLHLGYQVLRKMERYGNALVDERVDFLSKSLGESRAVIIELLDNGHGGLFSMDYNRLVRIMNILLGSGVSPTDIKNDLWVFYNNEMQIRTRLALAKEAGVKPIKPWVARCRESKFQEFLHRTRIALSIAGGDTHEHRIQYLSRRLAGYNMQDLLDRYPGMKKISVFKLKASFDFLYKFGITAEEIYYYPNILCADLNKLDVRFKLMESYELTKRVPLNVFYFPLEKFQQRLQRISTKNQVDVT